MDFERIAVEAYKTGGVPCIRGRQMPVAMVADGMTVEEILADFPEPQPEDIRLALLYASTVAPRRPITRPGARVQIRTRTRSRR